jgi:hypothetical protein
MIAERVEVRRLQREDVLVVADALLQQRPSHVGRHVARRLQQERAAWNAHADVVRCERHRLVHLLHAALPQLAAGLHVALLERLAGAERQSRSVPHQRLGVIRSGGEHFLAGGHPLGQSSVVACEAGEEIGSDNEVEARAGWPGRGLRRGEEQRSDERDNQGHD